MGSPRAQLLVRLHAGFRTFRLRQLTQAGQDGPALWIPTALPMAAARWHFGFVTGACGPPAGIVVGSVCGATAAATAGALLARRWRRGLQAGEQGESSQEAKSTADMASSQPNTQGGSGLWPGPPQSAAPRSSNGAVQPQEQGALQNEGSHMGLRLVRGSRWRMWKRPC